MDDTLFPLVCISDIPPYRIDHFLVESHDAAERLVHGIEPCFRLINGRKEDETEEISLAVPAKPAAEQSSWGLPWPFGAAPKQGQKDATKDIVNLDAEPTRPPVHPFMSPFEGKDLGQSALDLASICVPTCPTLFVAMDEETIYNDTVEIVYMNQKKHAIDHVRVSFRNAQKVLEQLRFGTLTLAEMQKYAAEHGGVYGKKRPAPRPEEIRERQQLISLDDY